MQNSEKYLLFQYFAGFVFNFFNYLKTANIIAREHFLNLFIS